MVEVNYVPVEGHSSFVEAEIKMFNLLANSYLLRLQKLVLAKKLSTSINFRVFFLMWCPLLWRWFSIKKIGIIWWNAFKFTLLSSFSCFQDHLFFQCILHRQNCKTAEVWLHVNLKALHKTVRPSKENSKRPKLNKFTVLPCTKLSPNLPFRNCVPLCHLLLATT